VKIIFFAVFLLVISLTFTQAASATVYQYEAVLDAGQEVPPNASTATGYGTFAFDSITKILDYTISFSGLSSSETGAHIHLADIGVDGPIQFTLPAGSPKTGSTVALSGAQETALYDGNLYVNIHSANNADGEIRGQLAEKKCLTCGNFNGDGYDDLAIGVPFENIGAVADAGAVNVIYGSSAGLHRFLSQADQIWTQDSVGIADVAEYGDQFGPSLSVGDFNNDGYDDLAVGVYLEDVGAVADAGAVNVIYGSSAGLHRFLSQANQFWSQDSVGIADVAETDDQFGTFHAYQSDL